MKRIIKYTLLSLGTILFILTITFIYSRSWENALFVDPIYKINSEEKLVALTFDDGPNPNRTSPLLDLLAKKKVKATFFMLGQNIEKHPEIAQMVFEKGHLIGNHTYNHPRMMLKSPQFMREQITRTDQLIQSLGQKDVKYFRPPYSYKYIVLPLVLRSMDKYLVTGTYDPPSEYKFPYDGKVVFDEVVEHLTPGMIIIICVNFLY